MNKVNNGLTLVTRCIFACLICWPICIVHAVEPPIKIGSTKEEVLDKLGEPTASVGAGDSLTFRYGKAKVKIRDGKVAYISRTLMAEIEGLLLEAPRTRSTPNVDSEETEESRQIRKARSAAKKEKSILINSLTKKLKETINNNLDLMAQALEKGFACVKELQYQESKARGAKKKGYDLQIRRIEQKCAELRGAQKELKKDLKRLRWKKIKTLEELLATYDLLPNQIRVGSTALLGPVRIRQILGATEALMQCVGKDGPSFIFLARGFNLIGEVDDAIGSLGAVKATSTYRYLTTAGASKTVVVVEPLEGPKLPQGTDRQPAGQVASRTGSGFFVSQDGYIVTNHHVVEGATDITVYTANQLDGKGAGISATIVGFDTKHDLALLKVSGSKSSTLPLRGRNEVLLGEAVYVAGFPIPNLLKSKFKFTTGSLSGNEGFEGASWQYQIDAAIMGGNSGGPVLDIYGNVIGVTVATLRGGQTANFCVKYNFLTNFLKRYSVMGLPTPSQQKMKPTEIAACAEDAVVLISVKTK